VTDEWKNYMEYCKLKAKYMPSA